MKNFCPRCKLNNFKTAKSCVKCLYDLQEVAGINGNNHKGKSIVLMVFRRAVVCLFTCLIAIAGFYYSLVFSAEPLGANQQASLDRAINILEKKGFTDEVFYLKKLTSFRGSDNWLNATVAKENAYAATNYPFEIMTIYPDFFTYTNDDLERAAILLHEAKHLQGFDEPIAYEFVWKNKKQLGWTKGYYNNSIVWQEIRKQTKEYAPNLFVCEFNEYKDCTE